MPETARLVIDDGVGSGNKQTGAQLSLVDGKYGLVALGPATRGEVRGQGLDRPLFRAGSHPGPNRYPAPHPLVQVCLGSPPVGLEEAVNAVPWNGHRVDSRSDCTRLPGQRGPASDQVGDLGQIVAGEPEPATPGGLTGVELEHDHAASDAPHL